MNEMEERGYGYRTVIPGSHLIGAKRIRIRPCQSGRSKKLTSKDENISGQYCG